MYGEIEEGKIKQKPKIAQDGKNKIKKPIQAVGQ
jgi:hypothetical protein